MRKKVVKLMVFYEIKKLDGYFNVNSPNISLSVSYPLNSNQTKSHQHETVEKLIRIFLRGLHKSPT
jgi:hypothetical protein